MAAILQFINTVKTLLPRWFIKGICKQDNITAESALITVAVASMQDQVAELKEEELCQVKQLEIFIASKDDNSTTNQQWKEEKRQGSAANYRSSATKIMPTLQLLNSQS